MIKEKLSGNLIYIVYVIFFTIYANIMPSDAKNQQIFNDFYLFFIIVLLHLIIMKKRCQITLLMNRYQTLDEFYLHMNLDNMKKTTGYLVCIGLITFCMMSICQFDFNIYIFFTSFVNMYLLLCFVNWGDMIDLLCGYKFKWKLILSIYIIISFLLYPMFQDLGSFSKINISNAYFMGTSFNLLNYLSIIIHYILILVFIKYRVNKSLKVSL